MPCKRAFLSIGALLGNLEGVRLLGLLREKKEYIWVPFLDPENIKISKSEGPWNFVKEQGCPESVSQRATKGPSVRPRYIRNVRARTQCHTTNQRVCCGADG